MISAILLAAGQSKRMGKENKLTKKINGTPLINHSIKNILASAVDELIIVLGHEKEIIEKFIIINKKIKITFNKNYESGIASSIKIGLDNLSKKNESFFIALADMPMVNQNIYNKLIKSKYNYNKKKSPMHKKEIIIPTYEGRNGNPILFSRFIKNKIMDIKGDFGAKKVIELFPDKILYVPFKNNSIILDFDNQENFENL